MSDELSKWQEASVRITQLKWEIEEALIKNFTREDMESEKYQQLLDTLDILMEHILKERREEREKQQQQEIEILKKKTSWFSFKPLVMAGAGAIIGEVVKVAMTMLFGS